MTTRELANLLGVPRSTVLAWRTRGKGPRAYAFGRELRFAEADVAAWLETQREDAR